MSSPGSGGRRSASSLSATPTPARPSTPRRLNSADMDYIIGDRIMVGSKPGIIAYLGEVKFATGDFAGVVLDEAVGKNDGSVKGTRYFQCEPLRGVFIRTSKLVRNTAGTSSGVRASPRLNRSAPSPKPATTRSKSTSSSSTGSTEGKRPSPSANISVVSPDSQNKTDDQVKQIQKEYETLMSGTRQKLEEFQLHIDKLAAENKELHKTIDEQKSHIEDLQFQLEEEILSKEDVMQELVNVKNNNQTDSPVQCDSELRVRELQSQLDDSVKVNSSLLEELEQVKTQLSDVEFQLAENESEKDNEVKEKKKMEEQIARPESQSACRTAVTNQSDNSHCSPLAEQLAEKTRKLKTLRENCSKLAAKERQLQERISTLESQHNTNNQSFRQLQDTLVSKHKIDIDTLKKEHSIELHRLRSQHKHDISNAQQDHNRIIIELKMQHQTLVQSLQQQLHEFHTDHARQSISSTPCSSCTAHLSQIDLLHRHSAELEAARDEQIKDLSVQVSNLTAERRQLQVAIETKSQMADQLKQQITKSQQQLTAWQAGIKEQMEVNQLKSEQDLECLRTELEASQSLLCQLEKKLQLSETDNSRLKSNLRMMTHELEQAKRALTASFRSGDTCNGTYRDTSDFLFNELKHQVEVMEVNMFRTTEEDLRLKEENELLKKKLIHLKHVMSYNRHGSHRHSQPRIFCDTCGAFDLHMTLECTRPYSTLTGVVPHSNGLHFSQSTAKQKCCNICNSQGHWTADCTVDE